MSSHDERAKRGRNLQNLIRLVSIGLVVAAVVKELRTDPADRQWHGTVAGFVPYDFRVPTAARVKERIWDPEGARIVNPRVFGVGWTVNVGRVVALARRRVTDAG